MKENKNEEILKSLTKEHTEQEHLFEDLMTRKDKKREKAEQKETKIKKKEKKKKHTQEINPEKERKEKMKQELKLIEKGKKKSKLHRLNIVISFLTIICSITYLLYILILGDKLINQPFLIINSTCLVILTISFAITTLLIKTKPKRIMNGITNILLGSFIIFNLLVNADIVKIKTQEVIGDLTNKSINEIIKWTSQNNIKLKQTYEYSESIEENKIIAQDQKSDTLVKDIKTLSVVVSDGPNLESIVNIPNMIGWNIDDVIKKIKEKKLSNVQIEFNFSDLTKDTAYEQSRSGDMRRNEELLLKFSLGKKEDLKPVPLKDLINEEEFDAVVWLKRNGIKYEITYEFDEKIEKGKIISTNPIKDTVIDQNTTTVKLVISKGKKIVAPDLTKMSLEEIAEWAIQNQVVISYDSEFSETVKKDQIIRVSIKKGDVIEENTEIYIITSKGALKMIDYKENDLESIRNFAKTYELTITETEEFSKDVEKGKVISVSHKPGDVINNGQNIEVIISLGSEIEIPNFVGMTVDKAKSECTKNELECTISYVYSTKTKNNVIYQNKTAGSKVTEGTNVVLTVSNGVAPASNNYKPTTPSTTPSTPQTPTPPTTPSTPTTPEQPSTPTCTPQTYTVGRGLNNIFAYASSYADTESKLYSYFATNTPGVKIIVTGITGSGMTPGSYIGGIGPTSQVTSCNTTPYEIQIAK